MTTKKGNYGTSSIKWLKGLEGVRAKPSMYLGESDGKGVLHMVKEIVGNSVDEAVNGHGSFIGIQVDGSTVTVADEGRGMPVGKHPDHPEMDTLTILATQLHAGGKLDADDGNYETSLGTHGVGLSVVNALSNKLTVWTFRKGKCFSQSFSKGTPDTPKPQVVQPPKFKVAGKLWTSGTIIQWQFDPTVFDKGAKLSTKDMIRWIKDVSWFIGHTKGRKRTMTTFKVEVDGKSATYHREDLRDYVNEQVARMRKVDFLTESIVCEQGANYDFVGAWTTSDEMLFQTAVNSAPTMFGGTHSKGALKAMEAAFKAFSKKAEFRSTDLMAGFIGCFNIRVPSPRFDSQSKTRLTSPQGEQLAYDAVMQAVTSWIRKHKDEAQLILDRACELYKLSSNSKVTRQLAAALKTKKRGKSLLPEGLRESLTKKPEERELFLLEGESAGGTAVQASLVQFQEILPLRGKVLNLAKANEDRLATSLAIVNILKSIGYDPKNPTGKLRIGKIFVLSDPDPDGPLAGDTLIPVEGRGLMKIKDMAEEWTLEEKPFRIQCQLPNQDTAQVAEAIDVKKMVSTKTRYTLTFADGSSFQCTADHKWALKRLKEGHTATLIPDRNGYNYIAASDLVAGDVLYTYANADLVLQSVQSEELEEEQDFYCMTVPSFHNFFVQYSATSAPVLSSNCHINALILTLLWMTVPYLFEEGRIYLVEAPLYTYTTPKTKYYGKTMQELTQQVDGKFNFANVQRMKGWGECSPKDLKTIAFDPETRMLKKVLMPEVNPRIVEQAMGSDTSLRRQILGLDT